MSTQNLTPEQAQQKALEAIADIDDVEMSHPKLRAGVYPRLKLLAVRAGIGGKFKKPFWAFEVRVLENDGKVTSNPVDSTAVYIINLSDNFVDTRKAVLKKVMNAFAGREVPASEYPAVLKDGPFDGNVISAVCTDEKAQSTGQAFVKIEPAFHSFKDPKEVEAEVASAVTNTLNDFNL